LTASHIVGGYWRAGRVVHRVYTSLPIIELELTGDVFDRARRDINAAIATPPDDRRAISLLVAAESCRHCGELPENWMTALTALVGAPWPDRLSASARLFVGQRWDAIECVVAELLYERRVLVSQVAALCGVREFAC
jgi:hypothetical protein